MGQKETRCDTLIEATATSLNEEVVALMLVAVQKDNVGLSVNLALKRRVHQFKGTVGGTVGISSGCAGSILRVGLISSAQ